MGTLDQVAAPAGYSAGETEEVMSGFVNQASVDA